MSAKPHGGGSVAAADDCNGFEPQNYLQDRCKKCFRLRAKHDVSALDATKSTVSTVAKGQRPASICGVPAVAAAVAGLMAGGTPPAHTPATSSTSLAARAVPLNVTVSMSKVSRGADIIVQNYNSAVSNSDGNGVTVKSRTTAGPTRNSTSGLMTTSLIVCDSLNSNASPSGCRPKSMTTSTSTDSISGSIGHSGATLKSSASFGKKERRGSWRTGAATFDEGADYDDAADSISLTSYKTANSKGVSSTKSTESVNSTVDSRSMVTAMSGGSTNDEDRAVTPTDDQDLTALRKENTRLQDQVMKLKNERQRWTRLRRRSKANLEDPIDERLAEAESLLQEYREENSMLKSEMRAIQDSAPIAASKKLLSAESRCEELTQKNAELQRNVDELQQEIEEMQDQYREEEIDEFRELQRDLEQNAKNCRILQFKLRKSERQRDNFAAEKSVLAAKLRDLQQQIAQTSSGTEASTVVGASAPGTTGELPKESRVRELESELRIAKEVSVRLHNELESAEDKRYKLEDEIFYYKEKLREMQTQNKWRETRNRGEKASKRHEDDGDGGVTVVEAGADGVDGTKELRDVLERETDLREQLKFSEEDLHRTKMRLKDAENENEELLQKLSEGKSILGSVNVVQPTDDSTSTSKKPRPLMIRSFSEDSSREATCSMGAYLRAYTLRADGKPYKTFATAGSTAADAKSIPSGSLTKDSATDSAEVEKDITKLLKTITELEQKNGELQIQLQKSEAKLVALQSQYVNATEHRGLSVELRKEQERRKELQDELIEYKQLIAKSDNNKLIAMATKVEILSNQLKSLSDRCETLHKKAAKDVKETKYTESLKTRCDALEHQLAEEKARQIFQPQSGRSVSAVGGKIPTADEIEQCCALLASVDAQTSRIAKQLDKMDFAQKEERRRSLSKDTYAHVAADLSSMIAELKVLHKLLETHKTYSKRDSANKTVASEEMSPAAASVAQPAMRACGACTDKTEEIAFYKKKNKELTNQILQTEDRWTAEIERQGVDHQAKIDKLKDEVNQLRASLREQTLAADTQAQAFGEKNKLIDELSAKLRRVESEMPDKLRIIQELEREQRELKEWKIRHKKLESLYGKEKQKFDAEKARIKTETSALKKRTDDALAELTRLRDGHQRREILWTEERARLERDISQLKGRLAELGRDDFNNNNIDQNATTRTVPIHTVNYRTAAVAAAARNDAKTDEQTERLRQKCLALEKQNEEAKHQLQSARTENSRLEAELMQNRQVWQRERDTVTHKSRQDEKIRGVEIEALQQKFTSRMNIMETSNKSLHSQLVQTQRDRDALRDSANANEKRLHEEICAIEAERARYAADVARLADVEKRLDDTLDKMKRLSSELTLAKESHRADKKLWMIEKEHLTIVNLANEKKTDITEEARNRLVENALRAAEDVQKQYSEYQKFYNDEVGRLQTKIKDLNCQLAANENEFQRKAKNLTKQIKILGIDQKNLVQVKEMQAGARDAMQAENARLTQLLQQTEVHRISRRYRIASIVEQLNALLERNAASATASGMRDARQLPQTAGTVQLISIINQLNALKENDGVIQGNCPTAIGETLSEADTTSQCSASVRSTPRANPAAHYGYRGGAIGTTQFGTLTASQRSGSVESNTTWDSRLLDYTARSVSPTKRVFYADTLHSNKSKPNYFVRMGSSMCQESTAAHGSSGAVNVVPPRLNLRQMRSMNTLMSSVADASADFGGPHTRMNSTGTNVLYKIRRQELSKGTSPSVRSIAQAFESIGSMDKARSNASPGTQLRGFFSMRKSRSVDNKAKKQKELERSMTSAINPPSGLQAGSPGTGSTSGLASNDDELSTNFTATLPRGGRNPFKNMGAKIVDRVRRSLSRSSRHDECVEKSAAAPKATTTPYDEIIASERTDQ